LIRMAVAGKPSAGAGWKIKTRAAILEHPLHPKR
jgi:hypothetical protein